MSRSADHDARNSLFRQTLGSKEAVKSSAVPTGTVIETRAKALNVDHHVEAVPNSDGAKLHFVGDSKANKLILYFHGGGYAISAFDGHVIFLVQSAEKLRAQGQNVVIAFLEYGLTPEKKYPVQLIQATEALRFLLSKGYKPSDIVVGGDSAGGNLVLGLTSVLLHPHPDVRPLKLEEPLAGLLLISPWINFDCETQSFKDNESHDVITRQITRELTADFVLPSERNNWSEPIRADVSWWRGLPAQKILNVFGSYEMLRDDDEKIGETLKDAGLTVESVECPLQVHIDCILDAQTGMEPGPMSIAIWRWLETVF